MLIDNFFNRPDESSSTSYYYSRAITHIEVIISSMEKLKRELNGQILHGVLTNKDSISEIEKEISETLPESEEAVFFKNLRKPDSKFYECSYEIIAPFLRLLTIKNSEAEVTI